MKFRFSGIFMVLLLNIVCYTLLNFYPDIEGSKELIFGMIVICTVILATYIVLYAFKLGDVYPFLIVAMLSSISIIILYSLGIQQSTADAGSKLINAAQNQVIWFLAGIAVFFVTYTVYRIIKIWDKIVLLYVLGALGLFVLTLLIAEDNVQDGVKNWITIGKISMQPSELIKLCFCFAMAGFFSKKEKITGFRSRLIGITREDIYAAAFIYLCFGLFVLQGELGTAVLFFLIYFSLMVIYDVPFIVPLGNLLLIGVACAGLYALSEVSATIASKLDLILVRFSIWKDPFVDPDGKGYQIIKSLEGITTGGHFGVGLGCSGAYLFPVVESDMIFSAICYEMGIFMGFAVIMMYFILAYRGFKIAMEVLSPFDRALASVISVCIAGQAFIIIGGVTKLIPLTGITMPFVSAGGSSMIVSFAMLGILTAISCKREKSKFSS